MEISQPGIDFAAEIATLFAGQPQLVSEQNLNCFGNRVDGLTAGALDRRESLRQQIVQRLSLA